MLVVTGKIQDVFYEAAVVSPDVLMQAYGIPSFKNSHGMFWAEFRLPEARVKHDRMGNKIHPKGYILQSAYDLITPEGAVRIQYATSSRMVNGELVYSVGSDNEMREFFGEAMIFTKSSDLEKYVWYYLHPRNATSPFASRNKPKFVYFNREAEANARVKEQQALMEVYAAINNASMESLRKRMRAIRFSHLGSAVTMRDPLVLTDAEVQYDFVSYLNKYGKAFVAAWYDSENSLEGSLLEAIDLGIIQKNIAGRTTSWIWSDNGEPIDVVRKGEDPFQKLMAAFQENYTEHGARLTLALSRVKLKDQKVVIKKPTLEKAVASEVRTWLDSELLAGFIQYDLIDFDRTSKVVSLLDDKGNIERPITELAGITGNWKTEFLQVLNTPVLQQEKELLIQRLVRAVSPDREAPNEKAEVITVPDGVFMQKPNKRSK